MNSTVGLQYTLHSVMFNAPAEAEALALQTMRKAYISLVNLLELYQDNVMSLLNLELYVCCHRFPVCFLYLQNHLLYL